MAILCVGITLNVLIARCSPKLDVERQDKARLVGGVRIDPSLDRNVSQCAHEDDLHP
jgi:hypothetical protein